MTDQRSDGRPVLSLAEQKEIIRVECGLPEGSFDPQRELSLAEKAFLEIPAPTTTSLALHADLLAGGTSLVIYEMDLQDPKTKAYLAGGPSGDKKDELAIVECLWASLMAVRHGALREEVGEDLAVAFTTWTPLKGESGQEADKRGFRSSLSLGPERIRGVYHGASRAILAQPVFGPHLVNTGNESVVRGIEIAALGIKSVVLAHSIVYQGTRTCRTYDPQGLRELMRKQVVIPEPTR